MVTKAHTYLNKPAVKSSVSIEFLQWAKAFNWPNSACNHLQHLGLWQTSRLGRLVCRYIQVAASSVSCFEYVRALGVTVDGKCWLDYTDFDILPLSWQVLPFTYSAISLWKGFRKRFFKECQFLFILLKLSNSSVGGNSHVQQSETLLKTNTTSTQFHCSKNLLQHLQEILCFSKAIKCTANLLKFCILNLQFKLLNSIQQICFRFSLSFRTLKLVLVCSKY